MKLVLCTLCMLASTLSGPPVPEARAHCNLAALTAADRARDQQLIPLLSGALRERKELPEGYAYRFDRAVLKELGEWLDIEAKCCQPLSYGLVLEPQPGGALWVQITGHDAKEFIAEEFAPLGKKLAAAGPQR